MLTSILRTELKDPIMSSLETWEWTIREYEHQSGEMVSDSIRASVLSSSIVNAKIREHLALNASRLPDYRSVREEVVKIVQAQKRWTTIDGEPTAEPMEVDALGKGKNKSKGKGKEKGLVKGKDKTRAETRARVRPARPTRSPTTRRRHGLATTAARQDTLPQPAARRPATRAKTARGSHP